MNKANNHKTPTNTAVANQLVTLALGISVGLFTLLGFASVQWISSYGVAVFSRPDRHCYRCRDRIPPTATLAGPTESAGLRDRDDDAGEGGSSWAASLILVFPRCKYVLFKDTWTVCLGRSFCCVACLVILV